jgi:hypothetical protein
VSKEPYVYGGPYKVNGDAFELGAIVESSWGYGQTNVNFWIVTKRTKTQVTLEELQPLTINHTGGMSGEAVPGGVWTELKDKERVIVRKLHRTDKGKEYARMRPTYGTIHPWDGTPQYCSWYA